MQPSVKTPPTGSDVNDPLPLAVRQSPLWKWATPILSAALLLSIAWRLRDIDLHRAIPTQPLFWMALLVYWAAPIISDFIIYRRLWKIPFEGLIALSRKQVGNALLFELLGETYFYGWARKKVAMKTSPFGAIKDVTIQSALTSNVITLALLAIMWPQFHALDLGVAAKPIAISIGVIAVVSILIVMFSKRLFTLSRSQLWQVAGVHLVRVICTTGLMAMIWSLYAPSVDFSVWVLLATAQLMLNRLPVLVNPDVVFANIVIWYLGAHSEIQQVVGVVTILILLVHFAAGALLALGDLVTVERPARVKPASDQAS
ncbi:MAG: hypothetical protein ABIW31_01935 [Novosphingobium sp.]